MSVSSNLKISVSRAFWRAVGGDSSGGAERERCRTEELKRLEVLRNVDRRGLPVRGGAAVGAQRALGLAAVEGVSGCGCLGLDLQEARPVGRCAMPGAPRAPAARPKTTYH